MAVVPGYLNDVFVSYVRDDDAACGGLVAEFLKMLTLQIKATGLKKFGPEIFFDVSDAQMGGDVEKQFASNARLSAVFIAFWSPLYLESRYCRAEWAAFTQAAQDLKGRIFIAELEPGIRDRAARELGCPHQPLTLPFYYETSGKHYAMTPSKQNLYGQDLRTLAIDISREAAATLEAMRARMLPEAIPRVPRVALLAPPAMEEFSQKTATACCQSGVLTLDTHGLNTLRNRKRDDGKCSAAEWLAEADVIADLIDPALPDAPVTEALPPAAPRLRWLRRDVPGTPVSDAVAALRKEPGFFESAHSEFVEELKRLASLTAKYRGQAVPPPAPPPPPGAGLASPPVTPPAPGSEEFVLILTYAGDSPRVVSLQDFLEQHSIPSDALEEVDSTDTANFPGLALPVVTQHTSRMKELIEALQPSMVVFVDGNGPAAWIDNRLRSCRLLPKPIRPDIRCVEVDPLPKTDRKARLGKDQYLDINKPDELQAFLQSLAP